MVTARRPLLVPHPIEAVPAELRGGVVAVGNFDGVHRGHAGLLAQARAEADRLGAPSVALTFEPHPRTIFRPDEPVFRLTPIGAKARLISALGLDGLVVATFDRAFAAITAEDFVATILRDRLGLKAAVVGFDFHFGKGRAGSPALLVAAGERDGFAVTVVPPIRSASGEPVASTAIRRALVDGDVAAANRLLGYRWFVTGEIVPGERRGRELGFPTANIRLGPDCQLRHGIYAVRMQRAGGAILDGVASYGRRPTFDNGPPLLEVMAFDFAGDLYGETVAVGFEGRIRAEEKFPSVEALISAMHRDSAAARAILAATGPGTALDRALTAIG